MRPEAQGQPGRRTFRILADSGSSSAIIWLEKEELFQLSLAIQKLMANLDEERGSSGAPPSELEAPGLTRLDFKVNRLALGFDETKELFLIDAHESEDTGDSDATVRIWARRQQIDDFAQEAIEVCAAGRPLCPLCERPVDPEGHQCTRLNGHMAGSAP